MRITPLIILLIGITTAISCVQKEQAEPSDYLNKQWKEVASRMPSEWYASEEARMVADSVLKYQTKIGGWAKNSGYHKGGVKQDEWARIQSSGIGATFDNDATLTEMKFLANIYAKQKDNRYHEAFMKALNYTFEAQYDNGGWPQYYPYRIGRTVAYSSHITYNDNSMVNVMNFLKDIMNDHELYESMQISDEMKSKAMHAFDKGVECILATQIKIDGKPTVWCAQHDEFTLAPAMARSYELPSFSGSESVGITLLLMDIENPSEEVVAAINGAYNWFQDHKISGIRIDEFRNEVGERDRVVVEDSTAPDVWARFYDLETGEPFFSNRDGIKKKTMADLDINRRGGYRWYTRAPEKVLEKYADWTGKVN
jgi:PelA/Pel-15E family pectate lyase